MRSSTRRVPASSARATSCSRRAMSNKRAGSASASTAAFVAGTPSTSPPSSSTPRRSFARAARPSWVSPPRPAMRDSCSTVRRTASALRRTSWGRSTRASTNPATFPASRVMPAGNRASRTSAVSREAAGSRSRWAVQAADTSPDTRPSTVADTRARTTGSSTAWTDGPSRARSHTPASAPGWARYCTSAGPREVCWAASCSAEKAPGAWDTHAARSARSTPAYSSPALCSLIAASASSGDQ
jgi:hypothetical protein